MTGILQRLRPLAQPRVMDLLTEAGLDVSNWKDGKGGAARAASNPAYCYRWSFEETGRLPVVNLWYSDAREDEEGILIDIKASATELLGPRLGRANDLFGVLRRARASGLPFRVILNSGTMNQSPDGSVITDKRRVVQRLLDPLPWHVEQVEPNAFSALLRRGPRPGGTVDQFESANQASPTPRKKVTTNGFVRDSTVRRRVLQRAQGRCELCSQVGFLLPDNSLFLETHHVVALADGGPDRDDNVIALCPNDHREAHFGARKIELCERMQSYLAQAPTKPNQQTPMQP